MSAPLRPLPPPETSDIRLCDGIFVKQMRFARRGTIIPQHGHVYDHLSYIAHGAVRAYADGDLLGVLVAGDSLVIRARVLHRFETLLDNTVILCIHNADRCIAGEVVIDQRHELDFSGEA